MVKVFIAIEAELYYLKLQLELSVLTPVFAAWLQRTGFKALICYQGIQPLGEGHFDTLGQVRRILL